MKKLLFLLLFIPLVSCDDSKKADKEEKAESSKSGCKENGNDFVFNGLLQGTQEGYNLKDKYGDDLIINGKRVPIPSVEHKFLFQKDFKVSLKQTSDEGLIVNYEGTYDIVRDDTDILEIECQLSDGDMSNPKMTIEYSKINKSYTFKAKDGSPNFKLLTENKALSNITDLGTKFGELICELNYYENLKDEENLEIAANKLEEYANELEGIYGKDLKNASTEFNSEFKAAMTSIIERCDQ